MIYGLCKLAHCPLSGYVWLRHEAYVFEEQLACSILASVIVPGRPVMRGGLVARRIRCIGGAVPFGRAHHARAVAGRHRRRGRAGHVLQVRAQLRSPDLCPVQV